MATPTNLPASFISGAILTSGEMNGLRGAFRILQVVSGSTTTPTGVASTTYVDSTLTATITPQSTSSLILVVISQNLYTEVDNSGTGLKLFRGATNTDTWTDLTFARAVTQHAFVILDSPSTTSATTYKTQISRTTGSGTNYAQVNNNKSTITLLEVSA